MAENGNLNDIMLSIGIDREALNTGLRQAVRDVSNASLEMAKSVQVVKDTFRTLTSGNPRVDQTGLLKNSEFKAAAMELQTYGQQLQRVTAARLEDQRVETEGAAMDKRHTAQRKADVAELETQFRSSMRAKDRIYQSEQSAKQAQMNRLDTEFRRALKIREMAEGGATNGGGGPTGNASFVTKMIERAFIYGAVYRTMSMLSSIASGTIERSVDLVRQGEQTGLGVEGAQRVQRVALSTNTPVETMTSSIARFQARVEEMSPTTLKAFDRIGLKASEVQRIIGTDLNEAIKLVMDRVGSTHDMGAFRDLFGGRGARDLLALEQYTKEMDTASRLTQEQAESVARIQKNWEAVKATVLDYAGSLLAASAKISEGKTPGASMMGMVGKLAEGLMMSGNSVPLIGKYLSWYGNLTGMQSFDAQREEAEAIMEEEKKKKAAEGKKEVPKMGEMPSSMRAALDEFAPTRFESETDKLRRRFQEVELGRRQGMISPGDYASAQQGYQRLVQEETTRENRKQFKEQQDASNEALQERQTRLQRIYSDLSTGGAGDQTHIEQQIHAVNRIVAGYDRGTVSLREMNSAMLALSKATDDYLDKPGLADVWKAFEHGLVGIEEVNKALSRKNSRGMIGEAEKAYEQGDLTDLEVSQIIREQQSDMYWNQSSFLENSYRPPNRPSSDLLRIEPDRRKPDVVYPSDKQSSSAPGGYGGMVNVIGLDEFSERMLRSWKADGLDG